MAVTRVQRHQLIRTLVHEHQIRTQGELADALRVSGCDVTQATISRDIADMDLRKGPDGVYVLAEDRRLRALLPVAVRETRRAANQVVVLTEPGSASSVAAAVDAACFGGVLGTIAGDDTVLVIAADADAAVRFQGDVDALLEGV